MEQMLDSGFDMSYIGPLFESQALRDLIGMIKRKTKNIGQFEDFITKRMLPESEYAERNVKFRQGMLAEAVGSSKIIARTPRVMDLTFQIKLAAAASMPIKMAMPSSVAE